LGVSNDFIKSRDHVLYAGTIYNCSAVSLREHAMAVSFLVTDHQCVNGASYAKMIYGTCTIRLCLP